MKKATTDAKKAAANDRENGNDKATKAVKGSKTAADEKYSIGSIETVKRGFLKEFCDFTKKKGTVDAETLVKEFNGRQIDGHKVDAARVARYIRYCVNNGQFKVMK
jgi:hypothetical protein